MLHDSHFSTTAELINSSYSNPFTLLPSYPLTLTLPLTIPSLIILHSLLPSYLLTFLPSYPLTLVHSLLPSYLLTFLPSYPRTLPLTFLPSYSSRTFLPSYLLTLLLSLSFFYPLTLLPSLPLSLPYSVSHSLLTNVNRNRCGLTGEIPSEIGQLVALEELQLFGNHLSGIIPASLVSTCLRYCTFVLFFVPYFTVLCLL